MKVPAAYATALVQFVCSECEVEPPEFAFGSEPETLLCGPCLRRNVTAAMRVTTSRAATLIEEAHCSHVEPRPACALCRNR